MVFLGASTVQTLTVSGFPLQLLYSGISVQFLAILRCILYSVEKFRWWSFFGGLNCVAVNCFRISVTAVLLRNICAISRHFEVHAVLRREIQMMVFFFWRGFNCAAIKFFWYFERKCILHIQGDLIGICDRWNNEVKGNVLVMLNFNQFDLKTEAASLPKGWDEPRKLHVAIWTTGAVKTWKRIGKFCSGTANLHVTSWTLYK